VYTGVDRQVACRIAWAENKEVPCFRFLKVLLILEFRYGFFDKPGSASAHLSTSDQFGSGFPCEDTDDIAAASAARIETYDQ
jgi:hypothetical protein